MFESRATVKDIIDMLVNVQIIKIRIMSQNLDFQVQKFVQIVPKVFNPKIRA